MESSRNRRRATDSKRQSSSPEYESSYSRDSHNRRKRDHHCDYDNSPPSRSKKYKEKEYSEYQQHRPSSSRYFEESKSSSSKDDYYHSSKRQSFNKSYWEDTQRNRSESRKSNVPGGERILDFLDGFSFCDHRRELTKIFSYDSTLISDVDDLWKFVAKFEAVQKKKSETIISASLAGNILISAI